jgi:orotidine-5'-phosphate decarboxylase
MSKEGHFSDRMTARIQSIESRLVVGIDPRLDCLPDGIEADDPEQALTHLGVGVIEAVAGLAAAVKPQVAFFERWGWRGWKALETVCRSASEHGIPVILDAKRGDIGSTAEAYAEALLGDEPGTLGPYVDALTVNPYLGSDSLEPFFCRVRDGGRGVFVLARTSNPGGGEFQKRPGDEIPEEIIQVREAAPGSFLLIPGIGAQGGSIGDIAGAFDGQGLGALVNSSRGIVQAFEKQPDRPWQEVVQEAAKESRDALEGVIWA